MEFVKPLTVIVGSRTRASLGEEQTIWECIKEVSPRSYLRWVNDTQGKNSYDTEDEDEMREEENHHNNHCVLQSVYRWGTRPRQSMGRPFHLPCRVDPRGSDSRYYDME